MIKAIKSDTMSSPAGGRFLIPICVLSSVGALTETRRTK